MREDVVESAGRDREDAAAAAAELSRDAERTMGGTP